MVGEGTGTRNGSLEIQGTTSFPRSTSPLTTEEDQQYRVPYSRLPISLGEELQLRGEGGNTGGCAPGCQAELPPTNKATLSKPASLTPSLAQRGPKDDSQLLMASVQAQSDLRPALTALSAFALVWGPAFSFRLLCSPLPY